MPLDSVAEVCLCDNADVYGAVTVANRVGDKAREGMGLFEEHVHLCADMLVAEILQP
jgi:hypothetical protein